MSDRPIPAVLAALAATVFVAAFAAAAVLRPENTAAPTSAAVAAPAAAQEDLRLATIAAPSLSRVAALPALHLPAHRRPAKKAAKAKANPKVLVTSARGPAATPAPTAVAPVRSAPVAKSEPKRPSTPNVGDTFDTSG
jgi:hypothetical protein